MDLMLPLLAKLTYRKISDPEKTLKCFSILKVPEVVVVFCAREMRMCFLVIVFRYQKFGLFFPNKEIPRLRKHSC